LTDIQWATDIVAKSRVAVRKTWERAALIRRHNQRRVLAAFRRAQVSEYHLAGTTGYGYNDPAREALEQIYADVFATESALVRPQVVSGTHAISASLFGLLRPGDELLSATGPPYDTLQRIIGGPGRSMQDWGITYQECPLTPEGTIDIETVTASISPNTRVVMLQRSRGYSLRRSLTAAEIGDAVRAIKAAAPDTICFVDNCYGEFVEEVEPTHFGVDLMAGSLIKNPGGTLAPAGGYVVGRADLIDRVADEITAPGLGARVGPMLGVGRLLLQGFYFAPLLVCEAVCSASLAAHVFASLGYSVSPRWDEVRGDTVQVIVLESREALLRFCQAVQAASPVDSTARPIPDELPGYTHHVIMAAGTFVQGSSSELSADGPLRPPYAVFMQGTISRDQTEVALETALCSLAAHGLLQNAALSASARMR
jgi:cystathionine beta-lyase family protein involved in aluminum resistance